MARARDAADVAAELIAGLEGAELRLVVVFACWQLDAPLLVRLLQQGLPVTVVGCTTFGVVGAPPDEAPIATAMGFYGDWIRVGVGIAADLPTSALARSRDAVDQAARALGLTPEALDPARHVAFTLVDGTCGHEESFCIGSAATAPQIRFVGGTAATELGSTRRSYVWAGGEALADAGVVVIVESQLPFEVVTSSHMLPTAVKTVVTAAAGRVITELDGRPAVDRLHELYMQLGDTLDVTRPPEYSFARFVEGVPYVRSMGRLEGTAIHLASAVEVGHVLRVMRPGDLIGQTRRALAAVAERVGGRIGALLAFSCAARHWEAETRHLERALAEAYAVYPTSGFQSYGEQTGMLLVNHTLTGLAFGARS